MLQHPQTETTLIYPPSQLCPKPYPLPQQFCLFTESCSKHEADHCSLDAFIVRQQMEGPANMTRVTRRRERISRGRHKILKQILKTAKRQHDAVTLPVPSTRLCCVKKIMEDVLNQLYTQGTILIISSLYRGQRLTYFLLFGFPPLETSDGMIIFWVLFLLILSSVYPSLVCVTIQMIPLSF